MEFSFPRKNFKKAKLLILLHEQKKSDLRQKVQSIIYEVGIWIDIWKRNVSLYCIVKTQPNVALNTDTSPAASELQDLLNVPNMLKWATKMFLKSATIFKSGIDFSV